MFAFIVRRLAISFVVLLVATYIVYVLTCFAGDPKVDLYGIVDDEARASRIAQRTEILHLDVNPFLRYFIWLKGIAGFLIGQGTLGVNRDGQAVGILLDNALSATMRLVLTSAITAIVLGVIVGIVSALRQYTGFDYFITFLAFVFFSLPVFWVAVLLKQFGAIKFNQWSREPTISPPIIAICAVSAGLLFVGMLGGERKRKLITFVTVAVVVALVLQYLSMVQWFKNPALGLGMVAAGCVLAALASTAVTAGFARSARRVLYATLATAVAGVISYFATSLVLINPTWWHILALIAITVAVCVGIGWLMGGLNRGQAIRASLMTGLLCGTLIFTDHALRAVPSYRRMIGGNMISTIGSNTPNFDGDFWQRFIDNQTHVILPTIALILISFASYTRYTRSSMLEVMNADYVRTARAKGLTERTVVMRHAFRNALIPVTTLAAYDFAAIIGGTVITETVFGWQGMGRLFFMGINNVDPAPVMGFFLVTGGVTVVFNMLADILYAYLDPRIRLS